ncbi:unnamed protein product, partial [marine sediment metagenome]
ARKQKLKDPLVVDAPALDQPTFDPDTGKPRIFQSGRIIESPDFAAIIDDQYDDLVATKTEGEPVDVGTPGKRQMITRTRLSPTEIKAKAIAGVDTFIASTGGMIAALCTPPTPPLFSNISCVFVCNSERRRFFSSISPIIGLTSISCNAWALRS